jgi:hypothetical protein
MKLILSLKSYEFSLCGFDFEDYGGVWYILYSLKLGVVKLLTVIFQNADFLLEKDRAERAS